MSTATSTTSRPRHSGPSQGSPGRTLTSATRTPLPAASTSRASTCSPPSNRFWINSTCRMECVGSGGS
uniref:Uncharacterized protein n=1 Tax=Arundo donax TaxID=35708 RepID=A0A0A8YAB6_ARUDO